MAYTTDGSVRGTCGHTHQTIEAAAACAARDQAACKRQGGYSDRQVVRADGERLSEDEYLSMTSDR